MSIYHVTRINVKKDQFLCHLTLLCSKFDQKNKSMNFKAKLQKPEKPYQKSRKLFLKYVIKYLKLLDANVFHCLLDEFYV